MSATFSPKPLLFLRVLGGGDGIGFKFAKALGESRITVMRFPAAERFEVEPLDFINDFREVGAGRKDVLEYLSIQDAFQR